MKKLLVALLLLVSSDALAETNCFVAKEGDKVLQSEGDCKTRHAPCSTFKIPLALIGFDSGILIDETHPEWPFKEGYIDTLEVWKQPHNPTTFMKNSCIWYSRIITEKLGAKSFKDYVNKLNYGNKDIAGDKGKNNSLTHSWLSSSLKISGDEQIVLIEKLLADKLPVSKKAQALTRNIMFVEELDGGWKLYGKTGSGSQPNADGTQNKDLQMGWFVGWVEKDNRKIVFAHYLADSEKNEKVAGPRAKQIAKDKLVEILSKLQN